MGGDEAIEEWEVVFTGFFVSEGEIRGFAECSLEALYVLFLLNVDKNIFDTSGVRK